MNLDYASYQIDLICLQCLLFKSNRIYVLLKRIQGILLRKAYDGYTVKEAFTAYNVL